MGNRPDDCPFADFGVRLRINHSRNQLVQPVVIIPAQRHVRFPCPDPLGGLTGGSSISCCDSMKVSTKARHGATKMQCRGRNDVLLIMAWLIAAAERQVHQRKIIRACEVARSAGHGIEQHGRWTESVAWPRYAYSLRCRCWGGGSLFYLGANSGSSRGAKEIAHICSYSNPISSISIIFSDG
jgi:hypothetical protein